QELVQRRVERLRRRLVDAAAGQDGAGGVVAVGVRQQIDPFDDQELALPALAVSRGVVERLQRAVGVAEVEAGLGVRALHRVVLGRDAVRVVDGDELERQRLAGRLGHRVLEQAVERQRRRAGADRAQERSPRGARRGRRLAAVRATAAIRQAHGVTLRLTNWGLRTNATSGSTTLGCWSAPRSAQVCAMTAFSGPAAGLSLRPAEPRNSWRGKHCCTLLLPASAAGSALLSA